MRKRESTSQASGAPLDSSLRFVDLLASKLAGPKGLANPMGDWIMVPRTRMGDDLAPWLKEAWALCRG